MITWKKYKIYILQPFMQKDVQATSTRWSGSNFFRHDSLQQSHQSPKPEVSNEKNAQMWIKTKEKHRTSIGGIWSLSPSQTATKG